MPVTNVLRYIRTVTYNVSGAQYIENVLTLPTAPDTATIFLGNDVYNTGTYVLFDYSASSAGTPVVGSLAQVSVDTSDLALVASATLANDTTRKVITVTLTADAFNGTQYIDGTLTISGPTTIYLSNELYGTAGTYTLFSYGSLSGSITDLTIIPPAGRFIDTSVSPNGCAISGSTITVKLN